MAQTIYYREQEGCPRERLESVGDVIRSMMETGYATYYDYSEEVDELHARGEVIHNEIWYGCETLSVVCDQ